ncbi:C-type lectin domain family 6 member A-like [Kryptolebias marmoratus]|uniref:C-type lectin domain family 6 member A-like n=1 Tax=Kryptolebias marmoratus TaxID=37003 RepID=UPI0007F86F3A|nr:C-type lectin domain family 6 member A-like [Kryptolebias marmoratus]
MGVNNGSTFLEEENLEPAADKSSLSDCRLVAHYLSLLCFLLTMVTLLQTLCLVQIIWTSQSQASLQENKLRDLKNQLEKLNRSHELLFSRYPALKQYCPVSNSSTGERHCRPCLAGWTPQGQKCFLFSEDRADWISSQYQCMSLGGAVATIKTEEEQMFLFQTAQTWRQGDSYWLGLRRSSTDGAWQWSDGTPLEERPQFWEREPGMAAEGSRLCGRLTPGENYRRSWFSSRCSAQLRRICERRRATLQ